MRLFHLPIVLIAALAPLAAQAAGDAGRGRTVAETWCLPCHASGTRGPSSDVAASFGWLVENRTPTAITGFLANPHGQMPSIQLSRGQIDDIVAYIESLKRR
jgi:mono/diheme cytochrome c family protein